MVYIQITELIFSNNEDIRELKFSLLEYMENLNTYLEDAERIKYLFFQPVYNYIYMHQSYCLNSYQRSTVK